ncbi:MAG: hypothetical protein HY831_04220 [Candidatus Aenigmarchaeota archaeon]|nr:hypothetical protein [Candidatus Aenigmarchaeota archaeon]
MAKKTQTVIKHREINPAVSAILNFILWGIGYIYNGKRLILGISLLLAMIIMHSTVFYLGFHFYLTTAGLMILLSHLIISLALAYDAYSDAKS